MTPALLASLMQAEDKTRLEDLYLPFKKKRRTKAQIALEAGLEPLADALLANPMLQPEEEAGKYLKPAFTTDQGDNPGVEDTKAALEGARQILMERFAEDAVLLQWLREYLLAHGVVESRSSRARKRRAPSTPIISTIPKPINTIPSHRALAMLRGRREEILHVSPAAGFRSGEGRNGMRRIIPAKRTLPCILASGTRTARLTHG